MNRVAVASVVVLLAGGCPGAQAIQIEAHGELVFDATTGEATGWAGTFNLERGGLTGTVSTSGADGLQIDIPVIGYMLGDRVVFGSRVEGDGPQVEFASEHLRYDVAEGTFRHGERTGTWTAAVRPLPGRARPSIEQTEVEVDPIYTDPAPKIHSICDALEEPRHLRNLGAMGEAALREDCEGEQHARLAPSNGLLGYLRRQLRRFKLWATAEWDAAERAYAQTPNVRANDPSTDIYPFITQSEPSLVVSGADPNVVLAGFNDTGSRPNGRTGWARSTNGGNTWTDMGPLTATIGTSAGDPVLVSNASGHFFFANVLNRPGQGRGIGVWRSTDNGFSFDEPVLASPPASSSADKPEMAMDRVTGHIFVCWSSFGIRLARSIDNGQTFIQAGEDHISDNGGPLLGSQTGCSVGVGPGHHVHVAWWDSTMNQIRMKTSSDFGSTFSGSDVVVGVAAPPPDLPCCAQAALNGNIRNIPFTSMVTDPLDPAKVFIVWDHFASGNSEVNFSASENFGAAGSWSVPVAVNDIAAGDQFQPRISSTVWSTAEPPVTAIRVVWYDRRNDPSNLAVELFSDVSFDGGQSWQENVAWSDGPFDIPQLCPTYECVGLAVCYMGDYIALASYYPHNSLFRAAWGDNRPPVASGPSCSGGPTETLDPNVWVSALGC
jgi:hypothetical protein